MDILLLAVITSAIAAICAVSLMAWLQVEEKRAKNQLAKNDYNVSRASIDIQHNSISWQFDFVSVKLSIYKVDRKWHIYHTNDLGERTFMTPGEVNRMLRRFAEEAAFAFDTTQDAARTEA